MKNQDEEYDFREQFPELYKVIQTAAESLSKYEELGQVKTDYLLIEQFEYGAAYILYNLDTFLPYLNSLGFYKK